MQREHMPETARRMEPVLRVLAQPHQFHDADGGGIVAGQQLGQLVHLRLDLLRHRDPLLGPHAEGPQPLHLVGWRELNVGTWLARVQAQEYTLRATGWVRVVAGIQSLLSIYLVAIWVLTYFGRPFQ